MSTLGWTIGMLQWIYREKAKLTKSPTEYMTCLSTC